MGVYLCIPRMIYRNFLAEHLFEVFDRSEHFLVLPGKAQTAHVFFITFKYVLA